MGFLLQEMCICTINTKAFVFLNKACICIQFPPLLRRMPLTNVWRLSEHTFPVFEPDSGRHFSSLGSVWLSCSLEIHARSAQQQASTSMSPKCSISRRSWSDAVWTQTRAKGVIVLFLLWITDKAPCFDDWWNHHQSGNLFFLHYLS